MHVYILYILKFNIYNLKKKLKKKPKTKTKKTNNMHLYRI